MMCSGTFMTLAGHAQLYRQERFNPVLYGQCTVSIACVCDNMHRSGEQPALRRFSSRSSRNSAPSLTFAGTSAAPVSCASASLPTCHMCKSQASHHM